jgi:hypothetical protein
MVIIAARTGEFARVGFAPVRTKDLMVSGACRDHRILHRSAKCADWLHQSSARSAGAPGEGGAVVEREVRELKYEGTEHGILAVYITGRLFELIIAIEWQFIVLTE